MKLKTLAAALILASAASTVNAQISVTGTLTSDYVFRGVSQTDSSPAIQASVDYEHDNGFFAGAWASNVDFDDDANAEIDYYVGYYGELSDALAYDASYTYYTYLGYGSDEDYDYGELILNAYYNAFTFTYGYANDYANLGDAAHYLSAAYEFALPEDYALTIQSGYNFGDAFDDYEYVDYSATLAKTFNGFDVSAAIINTDIDDADDNSDFRFVLSVSRTF